jgi:hypothetical protein
MMEAPWLLPTQNVTGVVELSTKTLRMFVNRGSRYSVHWDALMTPARPTSQAAR